MKFIRFTIIALSLIVLANSMLTSAWGHAAIVWAYVENNEVHVEAFYPSGTKIQNAKVVVVDKAGNTIFEGKTDAEGKYSYRPISKNTQKIVVIAGESHVGDFELSDEDLAAILLD